MADASTPTDAATLEQLLRDSAWVRRLALALASNAAAADDAAQDAWLAALRQVREGRSVNRGWWAAVLRNRTRIAHRAEHRLREREAAVAKPELLPDVADTIERLEQQQLLLRAVSELAEPYRTAIRLRWLEGMSPTEIAARYSVPVRTVHSRLNRGLAQLRSKLGGAERQPALWAACVAWLEDSLPSATAVFTLMKTKTKLALAATLACATILVWTAARDRDRAPAMPEAVAALAPIPHATRDRATAPAPQADARVAEEAPRESGAPAASATPELPHARVTGRIVDRDGNPIEQARVALAWKETASEAGASEAEAPHARATAEFETLTDVRGEYELTVPIEGTRSAALTVSKPPLFADSKFTLGIPGRGGQPAFVPGDCMFGELSLRPAYVLTGHVRDAHGSPIEGAQIIAGPVIGSSAQDGSYMLAGVDINYRSVAARKLGFRAQSIRDLTPPSAPGETVQADFALERAQTISGVVVDGDGQPVADAQVFAYTEIPEPAARPFRPRPAEARSALDGTFEIELKEDREHRLMAYGAGVARAPSILPSERVDAPVIQPGARGARVVIEASERAFLVARDARTGAAIAEFTVRAALSSERSSPSRAPAGMVLVQPISVRPTESGLASIDRDEEQRWYQCEATGYALASGEIESGSSAARPQVIAMEPEGRVRALVIGGAHALVTMERQHPDIANLSKQQVGLLPTGIVKGYDLDRYTGRQRLARCAADGRFEIVGLNAGTYRLTVHATNRAATHFEPIRVEAGATLELGTLEPQMAAAIQGVVHVAAGASPEGLKLLVRESVEKTQRLAADGRFRFSGLPAGTYEIRAEDHPVLGSSIAPLHVVLASGEQKSVVWRIEPARLVVHAHEGGQGLAQVRLELRSNTGPMDRPMLLGTTDAHGRTSGIASAGPSLFLLATSRAGVALGGLPIEPRLSAGEQRELQFPLECGSLLARWSDLDLPDEFFDDPNASIQFSLQGAGRGGYFGGFKALASGSTSDDHFLVARDRTVGIDRIAVGDWLVTAQPHFRTAVGAAKPAITKARVRIDPGQRTEALFERNAE